MKKKSTKQPELFWSKLVENYFEFCRSKFQEPPSFDGSSPRDLKSIVQSLRKRAEDSKVEWTEETAIARFNKFLDYSYRDRFLSQNFMLFTLNRHKDKIFFNIRRDTSMQYNYETDVRDKVANYKPFTEYQ